MNQSMLKNKLDKKIPDLDLSFEEILVCNDKRLRPFIEIIVQEPENIDQQGLGTLLGIFDVSDNSDDSSYIVNYLISVIKKEYFSKPKRGPVESFESALRKANLALSRLAEHGNVNWIGKLNVLCAVMEKSKLHLAQVGTASAFLLRSKMLTDVSEGIFEKSPEPNPLKTFDNLSSGKLEIEDKLILATGGIFEVFSFEEIKKSALRFTGSEFVQFLRTALVNQLEISAVLVIDVGEKIEVPTETVPRNRARHTNAFSQAAFIKEATRTDRASLEKEIGAKQEKSEKDFVNKKTGHIYIKESDQTRSGDNFYSIIISSGKNFFEFLGEFFGKFGYKSKKFLFLLFSNLKKIRFSEKISWLKEKAKNGFLTVWQGVVNRYKKIRSPRTPAAMNAAESLPQKDDQFQPPSQISWLPNFSRLSDILKSLTYEQRLYSILAVIAIFVLPYIGIKISNRIAQKKVIPVQEEVAPIIIPLVDDKNVVRLENLSTVYSGNSIVNLIYLKDKVFAISQSSITVLESQESFPLPTDFGEISMAAGMNDLNLIFLISKDKKITAFSAVSKKYLANNINIPDDSSISDAKTYLTYIYLLDAKNNQIYRYPRAEGGFGGKTNWIKESFNLANATGMAINENIFVANDNEILKLFRGKKQEFNMEQGVTPIKPYKVYETKDSENIYVLDKLNSRIVKLDSSGNIINQYYSPDMNSANDLAVAEDKNTVYFSTGSEIKSFKIEL